MSSQTVAEPRTADQPPMAASAVRVRLYGLRGAPPSYSAELMLRHKGIEYQRKNLFPGFHKRALPRRGFPGNTAPAAEINGRPVQTNRAIARALEKLVPAPPLFPLDAGLREAVNQAEQFVDEVFQHAVRRIVLFSLTQDPDSVEAHPKLGRLQVPRNRWLRARVMPQAFAGYGISEEVVAEHLASLPDWLDELDGYLASGALNGPRLNAADYQTAPLVAAIMGVRGHGDEVKGRPVGALADRVMG